MVFYLFIYFGLGFRVNVTECDQKVKYFTLHGNVKDGVFLLFRPMAEIYFARVKVYFLYCIK